MEMDSEMTGILMSLIIMLITDSNMTIDLRQ